MEINDLLDNALYVNILSASCINDDTMGKIVPAFIFKLGELKDVENAKNKTLELLERFKDDFLNPSCDNDPCISDKYRNIYLLAPALEMSFSDDKENIHNPSILRKVDSVNDVCNCILNINEVTTVYCVNKQIFRNIPSKKFEESFVAEDETKILQNKTCLYIKYAMDLFFSKIASYNDKKFSNTPTAPNLNIN